LKDLLGEGVDESGTVVADHSEHEVGHGGILSVGMPRRRGMRRETHAA
jgi:hypothetical protein